jgi:hypothetical protein
MKLVTLHYPAFVGMVSYTGIASTRSDSRDTAERVTEWLTGKPGLQFHEVVEVIRVEASRLAELAATEAGESQRLTLIAAAFVNHQPVVAIVSNFETAHGKLNGILPELRTSWASLAADQEPRVIVTGNKSAVSDEAKQDLSRLATQAGEDSARIRSGIQYLNRIAYSNSPDSSVSEGCTVVSMDSSGSGSQDIVSTGRLQTRSINNGYSFDAIVLASGLDPMPGR